jgi:hypothetical protein
MLKGFAHASRHHQHQHDRFRRGDTIITLDGKIKTVGVASASGSFARKQPFRPPFRTTVQPISRWR